MVLLRAPTARWFQGTGEKEEKEKEKKKKKKQVDSLFSRIPSSWVGTEVNPNGPDKTVGLQGSLCSCFVNSLDLAAPGRNQIAAYLVSLALTATTDDSLLAPRNFQL